MEFFYPQLVSGQISLHKDDPIQNICVIY